MCSLYQQKAFRVKRTVTRNRHAGPSSAASLCVRQRTLSGPAGGKHMQNCRLTLIRSCAGSSATAIVTALQLGRKAALSRARFAYEDITTKKDVDCKCHQGHTGEGTRVRQRALVAWESHLGDGSERMGEAGGGGMH